MSDQENHEESSRGILPGHSQELAEVEADVDAQGGARAKTFGHDRVTRLCGTIINRKQSETKITNSDTKQTGGKDEMLNIDHTDKGEVGSPKPKSRPRVSEICPKGLGSPRPNSTGKNRRRTVNAVNKSQLLVEEPDRPRTKSLTSLSSAITEEESGFQPQAAQLTLEERRRLMKGIHRRDTPKVATLETGKMQKGFIKQMRANAICLEEEEDAKRELSPVHRTQSDGAGRAQSRDIQSRSKSQTSDSKSHALIIEEDGGTDAKMASEIKRVSFKQRPLSNGSRKKLLRKNSPKVEPKVERLYATKFLPGDSTLCDDPRDVGTRPVYDQ